MGNVTDKSWNPAFNFIMEVKLEYLKKFGYVNYDYPKQDFSSVLDYWVHELDNPKYNDIMAFILTDQFDGMVLCQYKNIKMIMKNLKSRCSHDEFWELHDGIFKEFRGVVVDVIRDELIIAPFKKFKNLGEPNTFTIDDIAQRYDETEISTKLDGTMINGRYYNDSIILSSSKRIDPFRDDMNMLREAYCRICMSPEYIRMLQDYPTWTFIFELISPDNNLVVHYHKKDAGLYLVGIRDNTTGELLSYAHIDDIAIEYDVMKTLVHYGMSLVECKNMIANMEANEMEGFVLNIGGELVKWKTDKYLGVSKYIFQPNKMFKSAIEWISDNTYDDHYSRLPDNMKPEFDRISTDIKNYISVIDPLIHQLYLEIIHNIMRRNHISTLDQIDKKSFYNKLSEYDAYLYSSIESLHLGKEPDYLMNRNGRYVRWDELRKIVEVANLTLNHNPEVGRTCGKLYRNSKNTNKKENTNNDGTGKKD